MAIFKCKMCGGTIEFNQGDTVGVCDSCGTKQTLPKLDDEKRIQLFDRANYFRRENEFDKAMGIYEMIIADEKEDAEAYWGIVLCKYGIEYVEDPRTHKRIPTVNRAQYTSVFDDKDYQSAMKYADGYQRDVIEAEAKTIDAIQKGILEISNKEEPFDVFICYKETDSSGNRTQDSVYAQDIYKALIDEGYKVFFSRITLESKLGQQYEPYIFAALNSAKVMLAIGTSKENFEAVWVKNEWSRFLALTKTDKSKVLIPCYKDISPYDMPEEFTYLQSQDMGKIGFIQDLLHGISKVVKKTAQKETVVINSGNTEVEPLLKRAFMFLEDGDWDNANQYCERVLDIDPENAYAYLGKLMADLKIRKQDQLGEYLDGFENNQNYQKARRYTDSKLNSQLDEYLEKIKNTKLETAYKKALTLMSTAASEKEYLSIKDRFIALGDYKDSQSLAEKCKENAEIARKDNIYTLAKQLMNKGSISECQDAIKEFQSISGWNDSDEQIDLCKKRIEDLQVKEEKERLEKQKRNEQKILEAKIAAKKRKISIMVVSLLVCFFIGFGIFYSKSVLPKQKHNNALELIEENKYDEAYSMFEELGDNESILSSKYDRANSYIEAGDYNNAFLLLQNLDYKDSKKKLSEVRKELLKSIKVGSIFVLGKYEQDGNSSNGKENIEWQVLDVDGNNILLISKYAIDCQPYNTSYSNVTWETCSLRTWLNESFLTDSFTESEEKMIKDSNVSADMDDYGKTNPGNSTKDKVFILSRNEAKSYFKTDNVRVCVPTEYAKQNGVLDSAYEHGKENLYTCQWWLRTPFSNNREVFIVDETGDCSFGWKVNETYYAVRPAMWISLE